MTVQRRVEVVEVVEMVESIDAVDVVGWWLSKKIAWHLQCIK
jgi:hypothetical protein